MTVTGFRKTNWSLKAIGLTAVALFGLGGLQLVMGAEPASGQQRAPEVTTVPSTTGVSTDNMSFDMSQVKRARPHDRIQWSRDSAPTKYRMRRHSMDPNIGDDSDANEWIPETNPNQSRTLNNPDQLNEFTSYCYENNSLFSGPGTAATNYTTMLDVVNLAGSCSAPPVGVSNLHYAFYTGTTRPTLSYWGIEITFWDVYDPAGGFGGSVIDQTTGPIGGVVYNYGQIPTGGYYDREPITPALYFDDPQVAVQFRFVDTTLPDPPYPRGWGQSLFATGPPRFFSGGAFNPNAPLGSSDHFFYADTDLDGTLSTANLIPPYSNAIRNKQNFYLHVLGFQNPAETEPNDSMAAPDSACICSTRNASFDAAGDVDWVKFTVSEAGVYSATLDCGTQNTVMYLHNGGGTVIASNDDISGTNLCSSITANLAVGDYFLEIHDKAETGVYDYSLILKPQTQKVTGMNFSPTIIPAPKSVLVWDSAGTGATYDVVRGNILSLHTGGFCSDDGQTYVAGDFTSYCAVQGCYRSNLTTPTTTDLDPPMPPANGRFYIVRAENACQVVGTYDEGGNQDHPRDVQLFNNTGGFCP